MLKLEQNTHLLKVISSHKEIALCCTVSHHNVRCQKGILLVYIPSSRSIITQKPVWCYLSKEKGIVQSDLPIKSY